MSTTGNVRNLSESRTQALEALETVSDRLGEVLGIPEDVTSAKGELVNEEGLPIIDISEPLDELDTPSLTAATEEDEVIEDNYPEPISKLSPEALAISRKHRDKILDLLEEEEAREQRRTRQEREAELRQRREFARHEMRKRMETQGVELEKRRRTKDMEKKMGKALLRGLGDAEPATASKTSSNPSTNKGKKSVTFADNASVSNAAPSRSRQHVDGDDRGSVPGGLSAKQRQTSGAVPPQPMKMSVVERLPTLEQAPPSNTVPTPTPTPIRIEIRTIVDSDDDSHPEFHSDSTPDIESDGDDEVLSARRHRELALEYHRRRGNLRPEELYMLIQNKEEDENSQGWGDEDVPIEATLAHPPPKPTVSKFKAEVNSNKPRDVYHPASNPTSGSIVPPSALATEMKMGKLVDGNLVAGYEEGEEEREAKEEEEIRKLLLKSMEGYSTFVDSPSFPPPPTVADSPSISHPRSSPSVESQSSPPASLPDTSAKPPVSSGRASTTMADHVVERSANRDSRTSKVTERKPPRISRFKAERA